MTLGTTVFNVGKAQLPTHELAMAVDTGLGQELEGRRRGPAPYLVLPEHAPGRTNVGLHAASPGIPPPGKVQALRYFESPDGGEQDTD